MFESFSFKNVKTKMYSYMNMRFHKKKRFKNTHK